MTGEPFELLNEARWLRRLAERLARDGAAAEDLLQELMVRAWQRGPEDPARRGPWLVRVLNNLARKHRRGEKRRLGREEACAMPERMPAADEVAERLEAQRLLLDELAALDEPFRSALVLRYQDELTPAEIARRLGVPAGTVRWRLHEGLGRLRERLDRRHAGRREAWVLTCAPLVPRSGWTLLAAPSTWPLALGLAMNTTLKLGLAAAGLGLVALPVWLSTRPDGAPPPAQASLPPDVNAAQLTAPARIEAPPAPTASDRVAGTAEPAPAARPAEITAPVERPTRIEGRVVDGAGRPLAAAEAELVKLAAAPRAASDGEGRFALELAGPLPKDALQLRVSAPSFATRVVSVVARPHDTVQAGDVVLGAGGRIAGWVRTASGAPAPDVHVVAARPRTEAHWDDMQGPQLEPESAAATTDARGRFAIEGAPAGMVSVWARRPGADPEDTDERSDWVRCAPFELEPLGTREDVELVLPSDDGIGATAITGIVLGPDGEPVPHAHLRVDSRAPDGTFQESVFAGDDGRFVYDPHRQARTEIEARDPAGELRPVRRPDLRGGARDVELVLGEPRWLELAVHDAHGAAPAAFVVREKTHGGRSWPRPHEGKDGRLRLSVPIDRFELEVEAPGFALATLGPFEPELAPAELDCALTALPGLRGRVTHAGRPVAGATLELCAYAGPAQHVEARGFPQRLWCEVEETATSDADGHFLLSGRSAGARALLCTAPGYALAELGPLEVVPERGQADVDVVLVRGGTLAGQVRTAPGVAAAGLIVGVNRHDGHPRTQRTDEAGRFRFEGLTPGPLRVERVKVEVDPSDGNWMVDDERAEDPRSTTNCTIEDGRTTEFVLDLSGERPARLAAHLEVDGAPAASWSVVLWPVGVNTFQGDLPGGMLDPQGRLEVELDPGRYFVRFKDPRGTDFNGVAELELELPPGETPLEAAFATAALEGRWNGAVDEVIAVWSVTTEDGYHAKTFLGVDEQGRFQRDVLLAGKGQLQIQRKFAGGASALATRELELRPGERLRIELP